MDSGVSTTTGSTGSGTDSAVSGVTRLGDALSNTLTGSAGADTIVGFAGEDTLSGAAGNDIFIFSEGDSTQGSAVPSDPRRCHKGLDVRLEHN